MHGIEVVNLASQLLRELECALAWRAPESAGVEQQILYRHSQTNLRRMTGLVRQALITLQHTEKFERLLRRYRDHSRRLTSPTLVASLDAPLRVAISCTEQMLNGFGEAHITAKVLSATSMGTCANMAQRLSEVLGSTQVFLRQLLRDMHDARSEFGIDD